MAKAIKMPAPRNPEVASTRRLRVNPARRAKRAEIQPQNSDPKPPKNNGSTASCAASCFARFQCCCRYVGSQVMLKYQGNDRHAYCSHSSRTERDVSNFSHGTFP